MKIARLGPAGKRPRLDSDPIPQSRPEPMPLVDPHRSEDTRGTFKSRLLRPKGNLSRKELRLLVLLAVLPLVMLLIRVMALPGVVSSGIDVGFMRTIGGALNRALSLASVTPGERAQVLYLLLLPTCALLVSLTRLTLGIRVLGFRSILVAVGFHQCGIIPSLFLITVAVLTIVLVRPWLRKIRLPYYARVSVILCIVAVTMVSALLAGPWMRSDLLWGVVYFPVIVLGMLSEGIARTLDHDNMIAASWRAITTILLAFLIAIVCRIPWLRDLLLQFPELVLTQIVGIVMIAEFLDLRLLQDWDTKVAGMVLPKLFTNAGAYRVAVVRNRTDTGVIGQLGRGTSEKHRQRSVQRIVDALRAGGHTVKVLEGDTSLLKELRQFIPPNPLTGEPGGIVFNLAHGIQGQGPPTHVPAMLEMAGVAYTGPTPLGLALALDRFVVKTVMQEAGIPTPAFCLMATAKDEVADLRYPLIVKPRYESLYALKIVEDRQQLKAAVKTVVRRYRQEAVVEEYIEGRQIHVALLGNDRLECFPLVELGAGKRDRTCPAALDPSVERQIRHHAKTTFRACGCRDYARIDVRIGRSGIPYVCEIHTVGILAAGGSFARAAAKAGYAFDRLMRRIIEVARARYLSAESIAAMSVDPPSDAKPDAVPPAVNGQASWSRLGSG